MYVYVCVCGMCVCACVCVHAHTYMSFLCSICIQVLTEARRGHQILGTRVTGGADLSDRGTGSEPRSSSREVRALNL